MFGEILKGVIGPILGPLVDKIPDVNLRRKLEAEAEQNLLNALSGVVQAQIQVNMKEAQHASIFVAGWRPAIGWICGAGIGWNFVVQPLLMWGAFLFDVDLGNAPKLETAELMTILGGMLGLGGLRTFEKQKGVARTGINGNGA